MEKTYFYSWNWLRGFAAGMILMSTGLLNAQVVCENAPIDYTGKCESFNQFTGYRSSHSYKEGILNGRSEQFYRDGQLRYAVKYKNNFMTGKFSAYYESGELMTQGGFKSGTGNFTSYYENGEKKISGSFEAGKPHGIWLSYDEKGYFTDSLVSNERHRNGMLSYLLGESSLNNPRGDFFADMFDMDRFGNGGFEMDNFFSGDIDSIFQQMQDRMGDAMRRMQEQFDNFDSKGFDTTITWGSSDSTGTFKHFDYHSTPIDSNFGGTEREGIVDFPDVEPKFPGGEDARNEYVKSVIVYPSSDRETNEEETVFVEIVVSTKGIIQRSKIVLGGPDALNKEALRIVSGMPNWNPAMLNGNPVKSRCIVPIVFK